VVEGEGREKGPYSIKTCEKEAFYVIFEKLPLFEWNEQRCAIIWALDWQEGACPEPHHLED
jgi:hypothetical protein